VWFAICLQTSFLTPPVGFSLFYIKGVCPPGITTRHIYLGVLPFIALQLLALVFWFEPLATWLPNEVYGGGPPAPPADSNNNSNTERRL